MANFKFVISKGSKSYQVEKEQESCPIVGKKIGETFSGDFLGLDGFELTITGGSDSDGFPMRNDIETTGRKKLILTKGIGFASRKKIKKKVFKRHGMRKMKSIRGNTISLSITQINCKVSKEGSVKLDDVLGKKEEAKEGETPTEENTPAKKEAPKEEAKEKPKKEEPAEEKKK